MSNQTAIYSAIYNAISKMMLDLGGRFQSNFRLFPKGGSGTMAGNFRGCEGFWPSFAQFLSEEEIKTSQKIAFVKML